MKKLTCAIVSNLPDDEQKLTACIAEAWLNSGKGGKDEAIAIAIDDVRTWTGETDEAIEKTAKSLAEKAYFQPRKTKALSKAVDRLDVVKDEFGRDEALIVKVDRRTEKWMMRRAKAMSLMALLLPPILTVGPLIAIEANVAKGVVRRCGHMN